MIEILRNQIFPSEQRCCFHKMTTLSLAIVSTGRRPRWINITHTRVFIVILHQIREETKLRTKCRKLLSVRSIAVHDLHLPGVTS
jgi:hypothetical protein